MKVRVYPIIKASVYVSPFNRTDLIDENVTIVAISSTPKLKKKWRNG